MRKSRFERVEEAAVKVDPASVIGGVAAAAVAAPLTSHEIEAHASRNREVYGLRVEGAPAEIEPFIPPAPMRFPEPPDPIALLEEEVGSYESNVRELNDVRKLKSDLTKKLSKWDSNAKDKIDLEAMRLQHQMLTEREHSAREAIKLFNKGRLTTNLNLPTVRIEIVDYLEDSLNVEGDL